MKNLICPICAEGHLTRQVSTENVEYGDNLLVVKGLISSVCDSCGAEVIGLEDSRANKRLILEARKSADDLLLGAEVKALRNHYGITQRQAAQIFGGGVVAFTKYEGGDLMQSIPMDRLLRVASAVPEAMEWLAGYAGVKLSRRFSKPRTLHQFNAVFDSEGVGKSKKIYAMQSVSLKAACDIEYKGQNDNNYDTESISPQRLSAA